MISVIIPVYNVEKYIVGCLKSVLNQDLQDFELILVDDGSSDRSVNTAEEYLKDKGVEYTLITKENGGQGSSRNAGLKLAKGDFITFIDSDDAIAKDFLSSLYKEFDEKTDFTFCNFQYVKSQEGPIDDNDEKKIFDKETLLDAFLKRTVNIAVPSMMFRKSFLLDNDLYFDEKIRFSEDQLFIWNVILHSEKTVYLYRKLYGYYLRENSTMTGSSSDKVINSYRQYKEAIKSYFSAYPEYENIEEMILPRWELGTLYTSARMCKYDDFKKIYDEMDGKTIFRRVFGIGEIKAYLLAAVCSTSPKLLYNLCRRMDLNG